MAILTVPSILGQKIENGVLQNEFFAWKIVSFRLTSAVVTTIVNPVKW